MGPIPKIGIFKAGENKKKLVGGFNQPILKNNAQVKLEIFPKVGVEN